MISGGKEPIVVRFSARSNAAEKTAEIEKIMGDIEGVQDAHTDISTDVPQLQVEVNLVKAEKYGLKPGDVRRAAATLVAGEEVGDIFRNGKAYDVMVWSTLQTRSSVQDIKNLQLDTPSGQRVRLGQVAGSRAAQLAIDREATPPAGRECVGRGPRPWFSGSGTGAEARRRQVRSRLPPGGAR